MKKSLFGAVAFLLVCVSILSAASNPASRPATRPVSTRPATQASQKEILQTRIRLGIKSSLALKEIYDSVKSDADVPQGLAKIAETRKEFEKQEEELEEKAGDWKALNDDQEMELIGPELMEQYEKADGEMRKSMQNLMGRVSRDNLMKLLQMPK